jgi:hypothetical protein
MAFVASSLIGHAIPVRADIQDYEFRLIESEVKQTDHTILSVRLIHKPTGRGVPDAILFAHRLDMAPDGMLTMTSTLEPLPSTEAGLYQFKADLTMEGNWRLSLAAKVQGETGTLQSRLIFKAVE